MPSRFTNLAPHVERPPRVQDWDAYDDVPLDPGYMSLAHLAAVSRRLSK